MKVEHITYGGTTLIRNTDDILKSTIYHFKDFQRGSIMAPIQNTPFDCRVTVDNGIAAFDLIIRNNPLGLISTTLCCFKIEDKEEVMNWVKFIVDDSQLIVKRNDCKIDPSENLFLVTVINFNPTADLSMYLLAGEIEFYIYNAIMRGINIMNA